MKGLDELAPVHQHRHGVDIVAVHDGGEATLATQRLEVAATVGATAGSRLRRAEPETIAAVLAAHPPYVVIHGNPLALAADALADYDELLNRDDVRLLRHRSLSPSPTNEAVRGVHASS